MGYENNRSLEWVWSLTKNLPLVSELKEALDRREGVKIGRRGGLHWGTIYLFMLGGKIRQG
jgi:hypothetical protein